MYTMCWWLFIAGITQDKAHPLPAWLTSTGWLLLCIVWECSLHLGCLLCKPDCDYIRPKIAPGGRFSLHPKRASMDQAKRLEKRNTTNPQSRAAANPQMKINHQSGPCLTWWRMYSTVSRGDILNIIDLLDESMLMSVMTSSSLEVHH